MKIQGKTTILLAQRIVSVTFLTPLHFHYFTVLLLYYFTAITSLPRSAAIFINPITCPLPNSFSFFSFLPSFAFPTLKSCFVNCAYAHRYM